MKTILSTTVLLFFLFLGLTPFYACAKRDPDQWLTDQDMTHNHLGTIRIALTDYYKNNGHWPKNLYDPDFRLKEGIFHGTTLTRLHPWSRRVESYAFLRKIGSQGDRKTKDSRSYLHDLSGNIYKIDPSKLKDTGEWLYDPASGNIIVDCTHKDRYRNPIYSW